MKASVRLPLSAFWLTPNPITIWVDGDPQPFPKKDVGIINRTGQKPRLMPIDKDYRTRTNPITKKIEKYDKGYKRRWMNHVASTVIAEMRKHNLLQFPKNHPVAMGCLFFIRKSQSNRLWVPSQKPDEDNFLYAVRNALKKTDKGSDVLYYDDDQVVWQVGPVGKVWASDEFPPGVLITVQDAMYLLDDMAIYQPSLRAQQQEIL